MSGMSGVEPEPREEPADAAELVVLAATTDAAVELATVDATVVATVVMMTAPIVYDVTTAVMLSATAAS